MGIVENLGFEKELDDKEHYYSPLVFFVVVEYYIRRGFFWVFRLESVGLGAFVYAYLLDCFSGVFLWVVVGSCGVGLFW